MSFDSCNSSISSLESINDVFDYSNSNNRFRKTYKQNLQIFNLIIRMRSKDRKKKNGKNNRKKGKKLVKNNQICIIECRNTK